MVLWFACIAAISKIWTKLVWADEFIVLFVCNVCLEAHNLHIMPNSMLERRDLGFHLVSESILSMVSCSVQNQTAAVQNATNLHQLQRKITEFYTTQKLKKCVPRNCKHMAPKITRIWIKSIKSKRGCETNELTSPYRWHKPNNVLLLSSRKLKKLACHKHSTDWWIAANDDKLPKIHSCTG